MSPERETKLCKRFPLLFRGRHLSLRQNLMGFGCETGDGWYNIIYLACLGIEDETNKLYPLWYRKLYRPIKLFEHYWNKLMWKMPEFLRQGVDKWHCARFLLHFNEMPMFSQIKEKYGTLRLYMNLSSDAIDAYISIAEDASNSTCEQCGNYGKLRRNSWIYTACNEHAKKEDLEPWEADNANS